MNIAVFVAGIADPKWPLQIAPDGSGDGERRIMSPFDEAALEVALKLRDSDPETGIYVFCTGNAENEPVLRRSASFRANGIFRIDLEPQDRLDPQRLAGVLATSLDTAGVDCDLVLIGREFGDCDDGVVPPCLAETRGCPFFGLAQVVEFRDGEIALMRELATSQEWMTISGPVVASITNDRRNRLRHPLMKNVMAARTEKFRDITVSDKRESPLSVEVGAAAELSREVECRFLEGSAEEKAEKLSEFLLQWRRS